jgi:hypothetical protein
VEPNFCTKNFDFDYDQLPDSVDPSSPQLGIHHDMAMMPTGALLFALLHEIATDQFPGLQPEQTIAQQAIGMYSMTTNEFQNALAIYRNRLRQLNTPIVAELQDIIAKAYQGLEELRQQFSHLSPVFDRCLHAMSKLMDFVQNTVQGVRLVTTLVIPSSVDSVSPYSTGPWEVSNWSDSGYTSSMTTFGSPESQEAIAKDAEDLVETFPGNPKSKAVIPQTPKRALKVAIHGWLVCGQVFAQSFSVYLRVLLVLAQLK